MITELLCIVVVNAGLSSSVADAVQRWNARGFNLTLFPGRCAHAERWVFVQHGECPESPRADGCFMRKGEDWRNGRILIHYEQPGMDGTVWHELGHAVGCEHDDRRRQCRGLSSPPLPGRGFFSSPMP